VFFATLLVTNTARVNASGEVYYTNRENIEMTEQEYNNLLELGFTEAQIYRMDYQTFEDNKDIEGTLLSEEQQYVKTTITMRNGVKHYTTQVVSEFEYLTHLQMQQGSLSGGPGYSPNLSGNYYDGIMMDEYQLLTIIIVGIDDNTLRYKLDVEWLDIPSTRSWDIIGIGIEAYKVHLVSSVIFREDWVTTNNDYDHTELCCPKEETTGGSVMFELPSGSIRLIDAYIYFNVMKNQNVGTLTYVSAVGDYAHAITTISNPVDVRNYYIMTHGGLSIDAPYATSYVDQLEPEALFEGTW
jgi:hypothetical protein